MRFSPRRIGVLTVKCNGKQSHTRAHSENLIDNLVVWLDPTGEAEVTERRENEVWEPIPAKGNAANHREESIARHSPSVIAILCQ